jgi:ribose transport system substrate-binding protein
MRRFWGKSPHLTAVGVVAVALIFAGAAANVATGESHAETAKPIKIGFVNLGNSIPYAVEVQKSVVAAGKKAGVQVVTCDSALSVPKAIACVQAFKSEGVQGIAEYQYDQQAAPRVCKAGPKVPVVAVDILQPPCQKVFIGDDNFTAGKVSGVLLGNYAKTNFGCNVDALFSVNSPVNSGVIAREKGWETAFKAICPNVPVVKVTPSTYTTDATITPFTDTLTRYPGAHHIMVAAVNDDTGIGAVRAATAAGRLGDIYVSGQGADSTSYPYICQTTPFKNWLGDANYNPQSYGNLIVPTLLKLIKHQRVPKQVIVSTTPLTKANISSLFPSACK